MKIAFFKKKNLFFVFLFLLTFLLTLNQLLFRHEEDNKKEYNELYDVKLNRLDNMDRLLEYWNRITIQNGLEVNTREHVGLARDIVAQRFYHGYARYNIRNNYIAFFAGRCIWNHFLGIVIPDDILKYNGALCSQQAIVFGELLKERGYKIRKVMLEGHFCKEVFYNNSWHFYDPDMEPNFSKEMPKPGIKDLMGNKDLIYGAYEGKLDKISIDKIFRKYKTGKINSYPAKKMIVFHYVTKLLSNWLWVLFLWLALYFRNRPSGR